MLPGHVEVIRPRDIGQLIPQRTEYSKRDVVSAFNRTFISLSQLASPLLERRVQLGADRRNFTAEELKLILGFDLVSNCIERVMRTRETLFTDQPLSPDLDDYTFPIKFLKDPTRRFRQNVYFEVGELIPVEPLIPVVDTDKTRKEHDILAAYGVHYIDAYAEVGGQYPRFFDGRRQLEAFIISKDPLRRSENTFDPWRKFEDWSRASTDLHRRRVLMVPL